MEACTAWADAIFKIRNGRARLVLSLGSFEDLAAICAGRKAAEKICRHRRGGSSGGRPSRPTSSSVTSVEQHLSHNILPDRDTLHKWMNEPYVEVMWGFGGPNSEQEKFLLANSTVFPSLDAGMGNPLGILRVTE
ncbi:hypothetical protein CNMCM5623_006359 [Aspergillus felis]|uniref:Uncharacterized protein n=1 Tax=Aspergillus felis TaxID=1287682 RepID=A0A8H6V4Z8_9EURO|nr:hypothetical protein CNMCM5623_006359 [Aspergillus felis]